MHLKTAVTDSFLKLFYHEIADLALTRSNKLNLFILRIESNRFSYDALTQQLYDLIITFSLSRAEMDRLKDTPGGQKYKLACERLRNHLSNEGELGELLLYSFLEAHLKAPKILTKLELKTSPNDYVKGSDGVHLLKVGDNNFQLIFGESKLYSNLEQGINKAFDSIMEFLDKKKNKIAYEAHLLTSQLLKESVDEETYQFLKRIIVPTERDENIELDNSFGIFLGFDFEIAIDKMLLENNAFREFVRSETNGMTQKALKKIQENIENASLAGYNFYVYLMPFSELEKTRKEIIEKITV
jgi:hypothetical protein